MTDTVSRRLAEFTKHLTIDDLPAEAGGMATLSILDSVGAAYLTARRPLGSRVRSYLPAGFAAGTHPVLGGGRSSGTGAAWANAALMHGEDFDDTPHTSHFLAALLPIAERAHSGGPELLDAWLSAYEVWMILVDALAADRPFNPTSLVAPVAAAAAGARLAGLDTAGIQRAMAIATASSAGIRGHFGTEVKALDAARSAFAAVQAVELAEQGWSAEDDVLEADNGWVAAFGGGQRSADRIGQALDRPATAFPRVGRPPHAKAWPCCARHCGPLTAVFQLLEDPDVRGPVTAIDVQVGYDPVRTAAFRTRPRTALEAKFSVPYVLSAACLDGDVTAQTFDQSAFDRIRRHPLFDAVTVRYVPERAGPDGQETTAVEVTLADGTQRSTEVTGAQYLNLRQARDKLLTHSRPVLGDSDASALADLLSTLPDVPTLQPLFDLLGRGEHQSAKDAS